MRDIRRRTRFSVILFATSVMAAAVSDNSFAQPLISKSYSYFPIHGKTADDLDRELLRRGPKSRTSGLHHPGLTRIKFGGDVTYEEGNGKCRIKDVQVTVQMTIFLPQWRNRRHADRDLTLVWDTLSGDIKRHEERHAEIARSHAFETERALLALRPQSDCERMRAKVDEVSTAMLAEHDADQNRFDRLEALTFDRRMIRMLRLNLSRGRHLR